MMGGKPRNRRTCSWRRRRHFSSEVQKYKASRDDLELRDYEGIVEWLNTYRPNPGGRLYIKDHRLVLPGDPEYREPKKP